MFSNFHRFWRGLIPCFIVTGAGIASSLPIPLDPQHVSSATTIVPVLTKTWEGMKHRMVDAYSIPFVHRPKSEQPGDAVSEGIGYGMMAALYSNDQVYFNKIWNAAEDHMWAGQFYNWRVDAGGAVIGTGAASDADEDIACMLVFADELVKSGIWNSFTGSKGATYAQRATAMINNIWNLMVANGKYLDPGSPWAKGAFVNPSYFAPAYYRVFAAYQPGQHDWTGLLDQCYRSYSASPGAALGLVPDWMTPDGQYSTDKLGYNAYAGGKFMYKDGIRVNWRIALDYLWFKESRAKAILDNAMRFVATPAKANFFQMDGSEVTETFTLGNGASRKRTEHSHLTLGMWAPVALVSGNAAMADSFATALMAFHDANADYWGRAQDANSEDTLHNEMYFDQFLAWFGAATISGVMVNVYDVATHNRFSNTIKEYRDATIQPSTRYRLSRMGAGSFYIHADRGSVSGQGDNQARDLSSPLSQGLNNSSSNTGAIDIRILDLVGREVR